MTAPFSSATNMSRRALLARAGGGLGLFGLLSLLDRDGLLESRAHAEAIVRPTDLTERAPHFTTRAKRVIWIFINGGPSQVDTWDEKVALERWHGKTMEAFDPDFSPATGFFKNQVGSIMKSPFKFTPQGECGKPVSEIFPHLGKHVDKMAFLHSCYTESNNHSPALFMLNSGLPRMGFPCVGSWITYGLGSENQNLPGFMVMSDPKGRGLPKGNASNWGAAFLPGVFQGTHLRASGPPIDNMVRPAELSDEAQRAQLAWLEQLNQSLAVRHPGESDLEARIRTFELAYQMQQQAPEAFSIDGEPESIRKLYGMDDPRCEHFARQCLLARRLVERGVRFVQIYSGGMENERSWDGHKDIEGNHRQFAGETDQPVAGLLTDLAQRGLLDETLVIWAGEFGRLPIAQTGEKPGRDHNPHCFTAWMAGGGVKGGVSYGTSDEIGYRAADNPVHVNDFHATLLHLLGLDHERLTFKHNGRRFRLTDVGGKVITPILA